MTSDDYPYWTFEELRDVDRAYDDYLEMLEWKYRISRVETADPYEYADWEAGL